MRGFSPDLRWKANDISVSQGFERVGVYVSDAADSVLARSGFGVGTAVS